MHTIDLLKGHGVPPKTTLGSVIFIAIVFVLPLFIGALMVGIYAIDKTRIDVMESQKVRLENKASLSQPEMKEVSELKTEKGLYLARLNEVSKCVDTYLPWSPVLIALAENMPKQMVLDSLVVSNINTGTIKKNNDPNKPLVIPIPQKKMVAEISGQGEGSFNELVQGYQAKLKSEKKLLPYLKDLTNIIQARTGNSQADSFEMNFVFEKRKN